MHMAAATLGLASQWLSTVSTPYVHCMVKEWLGIPATLEIYDLMAVGYPAVKPRPKLLREKDKMVHFDYCGPEAFRTDEEEFYQVEELPADLGGQEAALLRWNQIYETVRPHQALGYKTPDQFYQDWLIAHHKGKEVLSDIS
jgi:transposase InsO family protein